jgi:DNA-binding response OmpR family regulator
MADIFIVEDDRAILRGLETNLRFEGHTVRSAIRGDVALEQLSQGPPDLLILDVMLPGLSGFDICRRVRRANGTVPILLLTARSDDVDKVMGLDLGADDYLTKPFSLTELLARVRALLRRGSSSAVVRLPDAVAFGDVSVDFRRYVTLRGGLAVHLTAREYALLRHLAAEAGLAVHRDILVSRVWGQDVNVTNRTVDTHVLALRHKLEPNPAKPRYLRTVHGIGYRLAIDDEG